MAAITDANMGLEEGWVGVQAWRDVGSQRAGWVSSHSPIPRSQLASAPVDAVVSDREI